MSPFKAANTVDICDIPVHFTRKCNVRMGDVRFTLFIHRDALPVTETGRERDLMGLHIHIATTTKHVYSLTEFLYTM